LIELYLASRRTSTYYETIIGFSAHRIIRI